MKVGVFVYARTDSSRLPGKVLKSFGESNLLGHVLSRANQIEASNWCVLTSDREVDNPIASQAKKMGFTVVRGSTNDLVARTLKALDECPVSHFVRVNADSPWVEPTIINFALENLGGPFTTNLLERRFPYGVSVEILERTCYQNLAIHAQPSELEHVTRHYYRLKLPGPTSSLVQARDDSGIRLTVDTPLDYKKMHRIFINPGVRPSESYWNFLSLDPPILTLNLVHSGPKLEPGTH